MISWNRFGFTAGVARRSSGSRRAAESVGGMGEAEERNKPGPQNRKDSDKGSVCVCVSAGTASQAKPRLSPFLLIKAA